VNRSRIKFVAWGIAAFVLAFLGVVGLISLTVPPNYPSEEQARHDFLSEHPQYIVRRVTVDEEEVVAACYRIFYHIPGDLTLHEEFRQYLYTDDTWQITHRTSTQ
jgi:hypothetical protein